MSWELRGFGIFAVVLFVACVIVTINVVVDLLYGVLDPRIRYE